MFKLGWMLGKSVRLSAVLAAISASGILINLAYQWYVLTRVGPGSETDALFAGMMVPQLMLTIVAGSLSYVLVPILATADEDSRGGLAWTLYQGMALFWGTLAAVLIVLAPYWVPLTVPGFDPATKRLAVHLSRVQLIGLVFTGVAGVQAAAYQARHRFAAAEGGAVVAALAGFGFLLWGLPRMGITAAAWATVIRSGCQTVLQVPALGPYHRPARHPGLDLAWRRMLPLLSGASYYKADGFFDRLLASMGPPGALSLYHLSLQLYASAHTVLNRAVVAPAVPRLARTSAAGEWQDFMALSRRRLRAMLLITLGLVPVLLLAGRPVLAAMLAHGQFSPARIEELWLILVLLSGVWIGGAAGQVLSTSFYATGDTRTPTRIGVVGFSIAIALKLLAFWYFGILGLAVAASLYYLGNSVALLVTLRRDLRRASVSDELRILAPL
ncbi:MAG TPA: lipid II flippase MurJ [Gemmatimonadales bacterium]|nr:lipid II flippase MurJ [Gemmatimonadales bacterium]